MYTTLENVTIVAFSAATQMAYARLSNQDSVSIPFSEFENTQNAKVGYNEYIVITDRFADKLAASHRNF